MPLAPEIKIYAPPFPGDLPWIGTAPLRMDKQLGRPVLVEFFDICRINSLRTLPYISEWHRKYETHGLRVIGIHSPGFEPSKNQQLVEETLQRLGVQYPVVVDEQLVIWQQYGNMGWPARYLWNQSGHLHYFHYGEGAYEETEREIQNLLGVEQATVPPFRPEDEPDALLIPQSEDYAGPYNGPYCAGEVWGVFDGQGEVTVNDTIKVPVSGGGCYPLVTHDHHSEGTLEMELGGTVRCHATCFLPGVAQPTVTESEA